VYPSACLHPDGSFDLITPAITLKGCFPTFDSPTWHVTRVQVDETAGRIVYELAEGALIVQLHEEDGLLAVASEFRDCPSAPWFTFPLRGRVEGATRLFVQGLGFSGPSGIINLPPPKQRWDLGFQEDAWSYESYLTTALIAPSGQAVVVGAHDHRDYLQRTAVFNRQYRRGLINRHLEDDEVFLEAGFSTECVPLARGGAPLPTLYLHAADCLESALGVFARAVAAEMHPRTHMAPRYHWCSWYQYGPECSLADLQKELDGIGPRGTATDMQALQIDDGHCTARGDWLEPKDLWPGGMQHAFELIRTYGYDAGIWIAPYIVDQKSRLAQDHPDWLLHTTDGELVVEKGMHGFVLDNSHPGAVAYVGEVFRTMRQWGATFYKTDFMDWGLRDSKFVARAVPGRTSMQYYRQMAEVIREAIGDESYWLGCIAPYAPMLGFADGIRIANDIHQRWTDGNVGNLLQEVQALQYANNVWWQNDPDVIYLRDYDHEFSDDEITSLAFLAGVTGGSVNTSCSVGTLLPERLKLWQFIHPPAQACSARFPLYGTDCPLVVAVRPCGVGHVALVLNPSHDAVVHETDLSTLGLPRTARMYDWGPGGSHEIDTTGIIDIQLAPHASRLVYVAAGDEAPPQTLAGPASPRAGE
jgi:hypothetical protein